MNEELIDMQTEDSFQIDEEAIVEIEIEPEDIEQNVDIDETVETIEVETVEEINIEIEEAVGWVGGNNTSHYSLYGRDERDQHPIVAITGLREELDEIKSLDVVYSDERNQANYYLWEDENVLQENRVGYFVSACEDINKIRFCTDDSNIFGVTVDGAGFIGAQSEVTRDIKYGLVVVSGIVHVRCEMPVSVGDYVISNDYGYAKVNKTGYKVVGRHNINGIEYAEIILVTPIERICEISDDVDNLSDRMDDAETNIVAAMNVANAAYNKSAEVGEISDEAIKNAIEAISKADGAVEEVDKMNIAISSVNEIAVQAKAIAESAVVSAESIRTEAVSEANKALAENSELRKEFEMKVAEIDTELDNAALELQATNESIKSTKNELQTNIDNISLELDNTKIDLNNTHDELSSEIDDIANSLNNTDKTIVSITKRVDENETSIDSLTAWKDTTSVAITDIQQKTDENSGSISVLTAWKSEVEDDVESIASIKIQSDANKSSIEGLTSWQSIANESLTSVKQQSDANKASIDSITLWQGETNESIAVVKQQADDNEASIKTLTEWKDSTSESIASIEQRVGGAESSISSLTSWQSDATTSIANVEQKSNANETKINSLTSWQTEASESIANVEQKATDNESAITSLTSWRDEATESISAVKQTADKNSADILLITSWKSDVEDDVSSIATIKTTADENKAAIEQLAKKDTELSTTIAGVKTTADANKASIEQITSWQSKVNPTINSVAGIKQTADDNAAKIEGLTSWQGETNIAMARIEQKADDNGASITSIVSSVDKYSIGEYSQAYGLTIEQARSILNKDMIYIPTKQGQYIYTHTEQYDDGTEQAQTFEFSCGFYYIWDGNWWIEDNTQCIALPYIDELGDQIPVGSDSLKFWFIDSETAPDGYEPMALYMWTETQDNGGETIWEWVKVNTLAGNASNRAVSMIRQKTNEIAVEVTNTSGDLAALDLRITDTESNVQSIASWTKDSDGNQYNLATIQQTANAAGASIAQVVNAVGKDGKVNAASIVTAVNDSGSSVVLEGDHIVLNGATTNGNGTFSVSTDGHMTAAGGWIGSWRIQTGYLQGYVDNNNYAEIWAPNASNNTNNNFIVVKNNNSWPFLVKADGSLTATKADITGKITADEGKIGDWLISNGSIHTSNSKFQIDIKVPTAYYDGTSATSSSGTFIAIKDINQNTWPFIVRSDGSLTADRANITGTVNANNGSIGGWTIGTNTIYSENSNNGVYINVPNGVGETSDHDVIAIKADGSWPFILYSNGKVVANKAKITGDITADSGNFANGVTIGGTSITAGDLRQLCRAAKGYTSDALQIQRIEATGGTVGGWTIGERSIGTENEYISIKIQGQPTMYQYTQLMNTKLTSYAYDDSSGSGTSRIGGSVFWSIVASNAETSSVVLTAESDANIKNSISPYTMEYDELFNNLQPCRYKYNNGTSNRYHTGFIAQEVVAAINESGLTTQDFAGVIHLDEPNCNGAEWLLRRDEFVALNTWQIQKAKARITELENRVAELEKLIKE